MQADDGAAGGTIPPFRQRPPWLCNVCEFDDCFIAPRFGYRDALDYHESNSARHFLSGVKQPALVLHALDDPWIPAACYASIDWPSLPMIDALLSPHGGHLVFSRSGQPGSAAQPRGAVVARAKAQACVGPAEASTEAASRAPILTARALTAFW